MDLDDLFKAAREEPGALPLIEDKDIYQKQIKVIRTWQLFAREVYQDDADLESYLELRKPPSVSCMKAFLRYLVRTRKGRVGKRPNLRTMKGNWHMIRTLIRKRSNCDISKLSIDIGHFIRQLPTLENASTKAKEKPLASPEVVIDVIDFLWRFDEYAFKTEAPRWRLQISFALLLMLFFGLRPGEFTDNRSDNKRKDENDTLAIGDGFKYGDFEPIAIAQDGGIRWVLKVRLRLRKGVRHIQASNVYFLLKQNLKHPRLCPVYHFFGFALADGALDQIRDAAQLSRVNVPPGRAAMPLKVRPSHQDIPVLQARDVGQKFCRSKFMPSNALNTALTMLGDRAGYQQSLTAYAIRRGHANTIDAQITTAQRLNRMGHSSASIFNSYISSTSVVDTQAIILGDDQESEVFDFSRSMQLNRDTTAPMPMSSRLTGIGAMKRPKELPYKERYRHADQRRAFRSRRGEHEENLSLFFDDCSDTEALPGRLPDTRQQSPYLRALLRCDRSRGDIAKLTEDEDSDGASFGSTLRIFELNARTTPMYHYPGVTPDVTGKCVFCEKDIHSWKGNAPMTRANRHLLKCELEHMCSDSNRQVAQRYKDLGSQILGHCGWASCEVELVHLSLDSVAEHMSSHIASVLSFPFDGPYLCAWKRCGHSAKHRWDLAKHLLYEHRMPYLLTRPVPREYCFQCAAFFDKGGPWERHCKQHLASPETICRCIEVNSVCVRGGSCPFCWTNRTIPAQKRFHQFYRPWYLCLHISKHVEDIEFPTSCPFSTCGVFLTSMDGSLQHFVDFHALNEGRFKPPPDRKFPHNDRKRIVQDAKPSEEDAIYTESLSRRLTHIRPGFEEEDGRHIFRLRDLEDVTEDEASVLGS